MRSDNHGGTRPPCKGKSANPDRFISILFYSATRKTHLPGNVEKSTPRIAYHVLGHGHRSAPAHHATFDDRGTPRHDRRRYPIGDRQPQFHALAPPRQTKE